MPALKNARHEAFARAIVEGRSGREAYRAAGYNAKDRAAEANASRLLRNAKVAARVAELKGDAAQATTITAARVLDELAKLAFANMADYIEIAADGQPRLDFSSLSRDQAAAIHELVVETRTEERGDKPPAVIVKAKFKLADKRGPLTDLGKHLGLFKDRVEHSGPDGGPIEVKRYTDIEVARLIGRLLKRVDANPAKTDPPKEAGEEAEAEASPPEGGT